MNIIQRIERSKYRPPLVRTKNQIQSLCEEMYDPFSRFEHSPYKLLTKTQIKGMVREMLHLGYPSFSEISQEFVFSMDKGSWMQISNAEKEFHWDEGFQTHCLLKTSLDDGKDDRNFEKPEKAEKAEKQEKSEKQENAEMKSGILFNGPVQLSKSQFQIMEHELTIAMDEIQEEIEGEDENDIEIDQKIEEEENDELLFLQEIIVNQDVQKISSTSPYFYDLTNEFKCFIQ